MAPTATNITPAGRRRRYLIAGVLLVAGAVVTLALVLADAGRGYRLLAGVPFAIGALALFQAWGYT